MCAAPGAWLCAGCASDLPRPASDVCPRCALPCPQSQLCGRCLRQPPAFDRCHAALRFAWPADSLVHAFKYRHMLHLARPLGRLLATSLPDRPAVDALIAMPLAPGRLRERGFNQAHELARRLARVYHVPLLTHLVQRQDSRVHLAGLPWDERRQHVRGAFVVNGPVPARLALVDDVMTSGSSLDELAATLRHAGAVHIEAWVLARTYPATDC